MKQVGILRVFLVGVIMAVMTVTSAHAENGKAGGIAIHHPWARASVGMSGTAGAFMVIYNMGPENDRLIAIETDAATMAMIHETRIKDDIMAMDHVSFLPVPAGGRTELKPGGFHIMLMDLSAPLKTGDTFSLKLTFEKAGTIEINVPVLKPGAMGQEHMNGQEHEHDQEHDHMKQGG